MLKVIYIRIKHIKTGETETFVDWDNFYEWADECFADQIYKSWTDLDQRERNAFEDQWEWLKHMPEHTTEQILNEHGYTYERIKKL